MLWGFLGLLPGTALDYLLDLLGLKATGTWVYIWYPIRSARHNCRSVAGLWHFAIIKRPAQSGRSSGHSTPSDWAFLILLWLAGVSGFPLEVAIYLPSRSVDVLAGGSHFVAFLNCSAIAFHQIRPRHLSHDGAVLHALKPCLRRNPTV